MARGGGRDGTNSAMDVGRPLIPPFLASKFLPGRGKRGGPSSCSILHYVYKPFAPPDSEGARKIVFSSFLLPAAILLLFLEKAAANKFGSRGQQRQQPFSSPSGKL